MEFNLLSHQIPHFERVVDIISRGRGYIDTSTMGCGKTYVTCKIASILNLKMLVICPKTVKPVWKGVAEKAGVKVIDLITYQSASSRLDKQPTHGFLRKYKKTIKRKRVNCFEITDKYKKLLETGILLVIDEVQFTRNNTAQYRAIQTLVRAISCSTNSKNTSYARNTSYAKNTSYYAILSATPFDKSPQAINLMKTLGIIRQEELFVRKQPTGWIELLNYCNTKDMALTQAILKRVKEKVGTTYHQECAYVLYSEIVRKQFCSAMPLKIDATCDAKNGYYKIEKDKQEAMKEAISQLRKAVNFIITANPVQVNRFAIYGELQRALVKIETCKTGIFIRLAKSHLRFTPNCKVVICINFLKNMETIQRSLRRYRPLLLHGSLKEDEREEIIEEFQNQGKRVLICITKVGGVGISLHDTVGDSPRVMLLSPTFNLVDTHQATGRVFRVGTKSNTIVRMVYADIEGTSEKAIQNVLVRKSKVLRNILEEYTRNNIVLPIDYKSVREV